jgi:hypothetical protein
MAGGDQLLCRRANRVLINVRQRDRSPRISKGLGGRETDARGGASN